LNYFNSKMEEVYEPSKNLSIDESMILWRGRLVFRQYIKNKRHKYGVKSYMLTEPWGFIHRIMVYSGQGHDISNTMSHSEYVVFKLEFGWEQLGLQCCHLLLRIENLQYSHTL